MNNRFNFKEALNNIKASLFDIYENQENRIGLEENEEKRNQLLNEFIELKTTALNLINKIESIYDDNMDNIYYSNQVNYNNTNYEGDKSVENQDESFPVNDLVINSNDDIDLNDTDNSSQIEEESINEDDNGYINNDVVNEKRYYLNCNFDKVNFAYVPKNIYEKIKNYKGNVEDTIQEEFNDDVSLNDEDDSTGISINIIKEERKIDNHFYKQDSEKQRGIIVRSDQYMKLALSRHRQAGVLEEAKQFRKEEVKRRQREEQKKELEKAELKFNI